jgi:hypothetical protein
VQPGSNVQCSAIKDFHRLHGDPLGEYTKSGGRQVFGVPLLRGFSKGTGLLRAASLEFPFVAFSKAARNDIAKRFGLRRPRE